MKPVPKCIKTEAEQLQLKLALKDAGYGHWQYGGMDGQVTNMKRGIRIIFKTRPGTTKGWRGGPDDKKILSSATILLRKKVDKEHTRYTPEGKPFYVDTDSTVDRISCVNTQELIEWLAEGKINPHISATYPLERAADALVDMAERRVTGKVVVLPGD